ncbi:MAG: hypothetical protein J6J36_04440 [Clostridia bacterium]|nr:hypothetical protein [Clostridia bacterium]
MYIQKNYPFVHNRRYVCYKYYYRLRFILVKLDIPYSIDLVFVNKAVKKELLDSIQEDGKEF